MYTAAEAGTLKISYVDGSYVSELPEGWVKDAANLCYTVPVTAGQVVKMNLWSTRAAGTFVYTIEFIVATPEVGGDDNQGGEGTDTPGSGDVVPTGAKAIVISSNYNGTVYYMTTSVSGGMITASKTDAGAWYMEETDDGFYIFYMDNGTKMYLYMTSGTSNDAYAVTSDAATAQVWYYDDASGMIMNRTYAGRYIAYHGSRGAFRTVNAGNTYGNPAASYEDVTA